MSIYKHCKSRTICSICKAFTTIYIRISNKLKSIINKILLCRWYSIICYRNCWLRTTAFRWTWIVIIIIRRRWWWALRIWTFRIWIVFWWTIFWRWWRWCCLFSSFTLFWWGILYFKSFFNIFCLNISILSIYKDACPSIWTANKIIFFTLSNHSNAICIFICFCSYIKGCSIYSYYFW